MAPRTDLVLPDVLYDLEQASGFCSKAQGIASASLRAGHREMIVLASGPVRTENNP